MLNKAKLWQAASSAETEMAKIGIAVKKNIAAEETKYFFHSGQKYHGK